MSQIQDMPSDIDTFLYLYEYKNNKMHKNMQKKTLLA